jgi:ABC-2 type transport system permease protein
VLLLTAVPAGFMGHLPVEILRSLDAGRLALLVAFAALTWSIASALFSAGLRRYESGNLMVLRG